MPTLSYAQFKIESVCKVIAQVKAVVHSAGNDTVLAGTSGIPDWSRCLFSSSTAVILTLEHWDVQRHHKEFYNWIPTFRLPFLSRTWIDVFARWNTTANEIWLLLKLKTPSQVTVQCCAYFMHFFRSCFLFWCLRAGFSLLRPYLLAAICLGEHILLSPQGRLQMSDRP